jgi:hypothetical protein
MAVKRLNTTMSALADKGRRIEAEEGWSHGCRRRITRLEVRYDAQSSPAIGAKSRINYGTKTKRPKLFRVMGRQLNSPPPKSAHNYPNLSLGGCEWLGWAISVLNGSTVVVEISRFHSAISLIDP